MKSDKNFMNKKKKMKIKKKKKNMVFHKLLMI